MQFRGIYVPVITPFNPDLSLNRDQWAQMVDHLISRGVHGLIVGGTTGEVYALSKEERLQQFAWASDIIGTRVPWLAGVNDMTTAGAAAYARAARDAGADGLLVAAPPYSQPTDRELASHVLEIDHTADLPIMLYNYPGRTGAMMGEEFLSRVGRSRNVQAIKESSGEIDRLHLLARDFQHLQLSCGADDQALEFFAWGAQSWVCAAANCLIDETIALYRVCVEEGDFVKGRRIMSALLPTMSTLERGGKFIQCVKYGCELQGLPAGGARQPLRPLEKELKRRMRQVMETARTGVAQILADGSGRKAKAA
ncbi:dihydrodipicolinate synthase family protein [Pelagibius sp. CAU 1746]|uniref:dihydrodipicolinate synthase family protein n=1 Tax=Pelagibius sp. CAU 1746 TaxID=3140370 RepID=UPI00325B985D